LVFLFKGNLIINILLGRAPCRGGKGPGYPRPNGVIRAGAAIFFCGRSVKKVFPRSNWFIRAGLTHWAQQYFLNGSKIKTINQ